MNDDVPPYEVVKAFIDRHYERLRAMGFTADEIAEFWRDECAKRGFTVDDAMRMVAYHARNTPDAEIRADAVRVLTEAIERDLQ